MSENGQSGPGSGLLDPGKKLIFIFRGLLFKLACMKITF